MCLWQWSLFLHLCFCGNIISSHTYFYMLKMSVINTDLNISFKTATRMNIFPVLSLKHEDHFLTNSRFLQPYIYIDDKQCCGLHVVCSWQCLSRHTDQPYGNSSLWRLKRRLAHVGGQCCAVSLSMCPTQLSQWTTLRSTPAIKCP